MLDHAVVPYLNVEWFYDTRYDGWSRTLAMGGTEVTVNQHFRFELYLARQENHLPTESTLGALGVVSAFVFYRTILKMSDRASLVASALYAASGLLLWVTFWGFGLHLASLAILPLALTFGVRALRPNNELGPGAKERGENWNSWRGSISNLIVAALMLAALNVTFHPTLIAALMLLGFIGLHALIARPNRIRTIQIGISLLALALLFSFPTLFHIEDFRREYYGRTPLATGLRDFIPGSDGFGTSLYTLSLVVGQTIPTPWLFAFARQVWDLTAFPVELIMCALVFVALVRLWRDRERRAWSRPVSSPGPTGCCSAATPAPGPSRPCGAPARSRRSPSCTASRRRRARSRRA